MPGVKGPRPTEASQWPRSEQSIAAARTLATYAEPGYSTGWQGAGSQNGSMARVLHRVLKVAAPVAVMLRPSAAWCVTGPRTEAWLWFMSAIGGVPSIDILAPLAGFSALAAALIVAGTAVFAGRQMVAANAVAQATLASSTRLFESAAKRLLQAQDLGQCAIDSAGQEAGQAGARLAGAAREMESRLQNIVEEAEGRLLGAAEVCRRCIVDLSGIPDQLSAAAERCAGANVPAIDAAVARLASVADGLPAVVEDAVAAIVSKASATSAAARHTLPDPPRVEGAQQQSPSEAAAPVQSENAMHEAANALRLVVARMDLALKDLRGLALRAYMASPSLGAATCMQELAAPYVPGWRGIDPCMPSTGDPAAAKTHQAMATTFDAARPPVPCFATAYDASGAPTGGTIKVARGFHGQIAALQAYAERLSTGNGIVDGGDRSPALLEMTGRLRSELQAAIARLQETAEILTRVTSATSCGEGLDRVAAVQENSHTTAFDL